MITSPGSPGTDYRHIRLLFVDNQADNFVLHRLEFAKALARFGFDIHVATPAGGGVETIRREGFEHHSIPLSRKSMAPQRELSTMHALFRLYRRIRPHVVHNLRLKPVLYGGIAARAAGVPACVNMLTGLGHLFIAPGRKVALARAFVLQGLRIALRPECHRTIVENVDDRDLLVRAGVACPQRTTILNGSGVDTNVYRPGPEPTGPPVVLCAARLLREKGIHEFLRAARLIREQNIPARFVLAGLPDSGNPSSLRPSDIQGAVDRGDVEWLGWSDDMPALIQRCHIACLPSYREGVPRFLIEAAACGKPLVATDVPGCREIVRNGSNGTTVMPRDSHALATGLRRLIIDPALRTAYGTASRRLAERTFSMEHSVSTTLSVYNSVLCR
jgi:glycosyltransferase involved in cell wall biosynthesis